MGWWWNRAKTEMGMNPPWLLSCWFGWRTVEENSSLRIFPGEASVTGVHPHHPNLEHIQPHPVPYRTGSHFPAVRPLASSFDARGPDSETSLLTKQPAPDKDTNHSHPGRWTNRGCAFTVGQRDWKESISLTIRNGGVFGQKDPLKIIPKTEKRVPFAAVA